MKDESLKGFAYCVVWLLKEPLSSTKLAKQVDILNYKGLFTPRIITVTKI